MEMGLWICSPARAFFRDDSRKLPPRGFTGINKADFAWIPKTAVNFRTWEWLAALSLAISTKMARPTWCWRAITGRSESFATITENLRRSPINLAWEGTLEG